MSVRLLLSSLRPNLEGVLLFGPLFKCFGNKWLGKLRYLKAWTICDYTFRQFGFRKRNNMPPNRCTEIPGMEERPWSNMSFLISSTGINGGLLMKSAHETLSQLALVLRTRRNGCCESLQYFLDTLQKALAN